MTKKKSETPKKSVKAKKEPRFPKPEKMFAGFFPVRPRVGRFLQAERILDTDMICGLLSNATNKQIAEVCESKEFLVESLFSPCKGSGSSTTTMVDLVVVIDSSGSMEPEAQSLSDSAGAAIKKAEQNCPSKLDVKWFGIEGIFTGTNFNTKLRDYLVGIGVADGDLKHRKESVYGYGAKEDGGRAIEDICKFYNWRAGAKRVIFFLGDEPLEGGEPQDAADKKAADDAINTANGENVTIYTYAGTGIENYEDATTGVKAVDEFARIATSTGGVAYGHSGDPVSEFEPVLVEIICKSTGEMCGPVQLPEIRPCFNLRWGDGPNDQIETHDTEILCLTASNPYSNVVLEEVTAYLFIVDGAGNRPPKLPDGTDALQIKPSFAICFGDLMPCNNGNHEKPSEKNCCEKGLTTISREVVLLSRNAKEGPYYIFVAYCYKAKFSLAFGSIFPIELVRS